MSDFDEDLFEALPETDRAAQKEVFQITDEDRANWILRKLGNLEAERRRVKAQAQKRLEQIDRDESSLMDWMGASLECWARAEIERQGGKRKSLTLLQGTVAFRTVPMSVSVADTEAATIYAQQYHSDLIKVQILLDKEGYRSLLKETGELLPGIEVKPAHEKFTIRFEEGK